MINREYNTTGRIVHYCELVLQIISKEIRVRYKQTLLGIAWVIIQPLAYMGIFTIVFSSYISKFNLDIPYSIFALSGLIIWTFFTSSLMRSQLSLLNNISLLTKIHVPHESVILGTILSFVFDLIVSLVLFSVIALIYGINVFKLSSVLILYPFIALLLMTYSISLFLSVIVIYFRDIQYLTSFIVRLMLFVTNIIYPSTFLPEKYRFIAQYNPISIIIESVRSILFAGKILRVREIGIILLCSVVLSCLGMMFVKYNEKRIVDVL